MRIELNRLWIALSLSAALVSAGACGDDDADIQPGPDGGDDDDSGDDDDDDYADDDFADSEEAEHGDDT